MPRSNPVLCGSIAARPSPLGVAMHNAAYRALGLPFVYVAFGVEDTREAVLAVRYLGIRGLGVSMPHKIAIMPSLDAVDEMAARIGAVNTVVNEGGRLTGYNTDWSGAMRAIQEQVEIAGTRAVVVGAGGAARAIVYGLVREHSQVTVYDRSVAKGEALARELGARFGGDLEDLASVDETDILVNATSVGFHAPEESIVPPSALRAGKVVLDVVFIPPRTKLVQDAEARGCVAIPGTRMLVHQAARQFELYTGQSAPFEVMEKALLERIQSL
ncbi:MAG TPA: shikimate dehydrogenase [Anaerolineae bacterium]|nr:shikimate dehydrogenase [Anaerolineae bacterium]